MSITDAFVGALEANMDEFDLLDDELAAYVATTFAAMVKRTRVAGDVRQAAELLETGLASLSRGTQIGGRNSSGNPVLASEVAGSLELGP